MKKTYISKIIVHNYILYKGDLTYIETFPVDSGMPLIFTDFQHSKWCRSTGQEFCLQIMITTVEWKLLHSDNQFQFKARAHWAAAKEFFCPSRMGNIGIYGAVHMETCGKGNSKGVIINWVLYPIVTATATTKFPLPLLQLSVNESLHQSRHKWELPEKNVPRIVPHRNSVKSYQLVAM